MQPNVGITGTNVKGPVIHTATQPIVQPHVLQGMSHDAEEAKNKLEFLEERFRALKEEATLDLEMLQVYVSFRVCDSSQVQGP